MSGGAGRIFGGADRNGNIANVTGGRLHVTAITGSSPLTVRIEEDLNVLSASTLGQPIAVAGVLTTLHTVPASKIDEITAYISNPTSLDITVAIDWGGGSEDLEVFCPSNETVVLVDGMLLGAASVFKVRNISNGSTLHVIGRVSRNDA